MDEVCYVLQLEIIECSRAQHSKKRDVPDEIREQDIRKMLKTLNIPMGLLYVTVAHTKHVAHSDDVFFHKPKDEYEVIPDRLLAFSERLTEVCAALSDMFENRFDTTRFIGH